MNSSIKTNYPSTYKDPNVGHKSVSFRATPKEVKKLEEIQEILSELHLNNSITNAFRVVFHYFNTDHMRKGKEDDESYRGSSVLGVSLDTILRLESPDYGSPDGTVTFNIIDEKKRHSDTYSWYVQLNLNTNEWQLYDAYHQDLRHDMMLDIIESNKFRTQSDIGKVLGLGDTAISKYLNEMYEAKVGESELGKTKKDVMKKVRQTLSDTKKSYRMRTDEDVLEEESIW